MHSVMSHYHENIMHIRDPSYRASEVARSKLVEQYEKKEERKRRMSVGKKISAEGSSDGAREEKTGDSAHVLSDGHSQVYLGDSSQDIDDHLTKMHSTSRRTEEAQTEKLVDFSSFPTTIASSSSIDVSEEWDVIEFSDGSSVLVPARTEIPRGGAHASTLTRQVWSAQKARRLSSNSVKEMYLNGTRALYNTHTPGKRQVLDVERDFGIQHFDTSDPRYLKSDESIMEGHRRSLQIPGGVQVDNSFTTLPYRHPQQCERKQCLVSTSANCKEHLKGYHCPRSNIERSLR